ncbi:hypothetical protein HK103_007440 [Boothiomyces macroporosus]|uniref:Uncharacterized protein n=1 Tax=Boothiomyces macroporosus TaxID=261099 RepID=A0AAD5UPF5_9FUNG|nr:hypothetical protein HK103_007440 [Boothiomyces macroporosus]
METFNQKSEKVIATEPRKGGANSWGSIQDQIQLGVENISQFVIMQPQKYIQFVDKQEFDSLRTQLVVDQIEPDIQQAIDESIKQMELEQALEQIREFELNSFIQSSSADSELEAALALSLIEH